jgi:N6-adenosine-specific RNA methylase IME4
VRLMGDVPRLEMFARESAPGWDVWGLEVESTIALLKGKRVVRQGTFSGAHEVKA